MRVIIKDEGLKEAERRLGKLVVRDRGLLDTEDVRRELEHSVARRFQRGLRQAKRAWRLEKRKRGLRDRPLQATGSAFRALTSGTGPAASGVQFKRVYGGVVFGVKPGRGDLYYMHVHSRGYETSGGRVAPRRAVVIDKQARENIAGFVLRRLTED